MTRLDDLVIKCDALLKRLIKTQSEVRGFDPDTVTPNELELTSLELTNIKTKADAFFEEMFGLCTSAEFQTKHDPNFDTIFTSIRTLSLKVLDLKDAKKVATNRQTGFKLERVKLPQFGGNFCDWQEFHDLFKSAVHENQALSSSEK